MASQSDASPISPSSVRDVLKQPYNHDESSVVKDEVERLNVASVLDQRLKYRIRRLRIIQRLANLVFSVIVLGIILNTYLAFVNNGSASTNDNAMPVYPPHPITWPTLLMLGTGVVSLVFNISILIAYRSSIAAANRVDTFGSYFGYAVHVLNFIVWIIASSAFKGMQGAADAHPPPTDLWGWSCSSAAAALDQSAVNFKLQCRSQIVSFALGISNAGLEILSLIINFYVIRRLLRQKKKGLLEQLNRIAKIRS